MSEAKGFIKTASVSTIAVATNDGNGFVKSAAYEDNKSDFINGRKPIDIIASLKIVANEYDISDNPTDYIFEAIRGNTTNVPNENKDAFHKNELLRFDHRLGKHVYRTYELKPHHINHRADNPKNARGFIVDAHYNDSASPLDKCPNCGNKTASADERDPETGIHCRKCGDIVKDEFVELLVAIDTKKDPSFAKGVKTGILKHGSMGCSCLRTRCNVCTNVAYSRSEFCKHIEGNNKGKEYNDSEPGFNPIAFVIKKVNGVLKKVARSFEWCEGVIYDEYSRVHDPADIKAEQYEILKLSSRVDELSKTDILAHESEILMLQTKVAELENIIKEKLTKTAQIPPLPGPPPGAAPGGPPAGGLPGLPPPEAPAPGMEPKPPEEEEEKVEVNINVGEEGVEVKSPQLEELAGGGPSLEEQAAEGPGGPGGPMGPAAVGLAPTPEEMGITPTPPRRGNKETSGGPPMLRFADSYKNLKAEITSVGNVRVFDDEGTIFVVKPENVDSSRVASADSEDLAKKVLIMTAQYGMGGAINRTRAIVGPRLAQVLEYHLDDMADVDRTDTSSVLDEADMDTKDKRPSGPESTTAQGADSDRKDEYDETVSSDKSDVLTGRDTDVEDEQHDRNSGDLAVVEMHDQDMRDKREEYKMSDSAVDDITLDHAEKAAGKTKSPSKEDEKKKKKEEEKKAEKTGEEECPSEKKKKEKKKAEEEYDIKKHAANLEKLYKNKYEKHVAEFEKNLTDRFARALKLVAKRQALNLEYSPIKTAIGIALCNSRPLGEGYIYEPMDQKTAVTLTEAAFNEPIIEGIDLPPWEAFIDGLIERGAEIMNWNDETLMQVEADLKNVNAVAVPVSETAETTFNDNGLRREASNGNLQLNPQPPSDGPIGNDKRNAIRKAVGTTKVAGLANASK